MEWNLFLRWWTFFLLFLLAIVMAIIIGLPAMLYAADFTYLSFVIFILLFYFSVKNGIFVMKLSRKPTLLQEEYDEFCRNNDLIWFISDIVLTLGMIGTVIGFIYMLSTSFSGLAVLNTEIVRNILGTMSTGMSTALYTTASGLIASLLLKIQAFDFSSTLNKKAKKCHFCNESTEFEDGV